MSLECKLVATAEQRGKMDEAIRTAQFVRNRCVRFWMDGEKVSKNDVYKHTTALQAEFSWCKQLNSTAVQAAGERAWSATSRFYDNHKRGVRPVGYPQFKKNVRSVEYKQSGWKLDAANERVTFTDGFGIGKMKFKGSWDLMLYPVGLFKRVRIVCRADGYYVQFLVDVGRYLDIQPTGKTIGLDVGLKSFYTDSEGKEEPNPRFYRKAEQALKKLGCRVSKKVKGSHNRRKAVKKLARKHLRVQRQRKDHAVKLARCVVMSNDLIAFEDLKVRNMKRSRRLCKSISDASWTHFRNWVEYFGKIFGKVTIAVNPAYTSQICSRCGQTVKKDLKVRQHVWMWGQHGPRLQRRYQHPKTWTPYGGARQNGRGNSRNACGDSCKPSSCWQQVAEARISLIYRWECQ
jgi:putative transposase